MRILKKKEIHLVANVKIAYMPIFIVLPPADKAGICFVSGVCAKIYPKSLCEASRDKIFGREKINI